MGKINFFCINLDKRTDRWELAKKSFHKQGLNVKRWSAKPLPENRRFGSGLSHREIIEEASNKNWKSVGIFEDDIDFLGDNFKNEMDNALIELAGKEWYALYFGGSIGRNGSLKNEKNISRLLKAEGLYQVHAVIYNNPLFSLVLENYPNKYDSKKGECYIKGKYKTIDEWLALEIQPQYPCYVTERILVVQKDDYSDIEKKIVKRSNKSIYRFYAFKYLGSNIATSLDIIFSNIKNFFSFLKDKIG